MDKLKQAMQSEDFGLNLQIHHLVRSYFMVKIQTVLHAMSIMRCQERLIRMEILLLSFLRLMRK